MAKIVGIQFSILSPEEIRNGSVAAITSRDTYVNNKPVIGGLFDPRMGVLEPGYVCPTDGLDYIKTPGYFGHINLAKPVFYVQYLNTVIKILRCTCFKCSKLLINKENYQHALQMNSEDRWNFVFGLASKVKRCGDDTCDGCGCKQPSKIRKEGLATLTAVWDKMDGVDSDELSMTITPEMVIKQFRRISDEDVAFMGFSPVWSRPDWMVCQVLAVPPPAVRPSVKHDSQQRSEDDLTHIIVNIIKANKMLQEKMDGNANEHIINDWALLLQYHVSTLVDNDIPGVAVAAQRSGRPLKAVKGRLNGKGGRIRGNLMGKRVDFSARSVITPDPNLSITELGVPKKVAMNLTSPVCVNERNLAFLTKLVQNGPDEYPGAKMLVRKNGDNISLRYVDRKSIQLKPGDVVHRHMMDGDPVLFNRQPTLHRMSMMCHRTKVMPRGDTFRMNVACTKPYNADFDGDEMNMHMPQSVRSSSELMNLAAVPWQLISPANNKPIIGIFQDSLLGAHRITRPDIHFTPREAMNLLMAFDKVDVSKLNGKGFKSFDILSQIMPPLSLKYKTKRFGDDEDYETSNNVLDIHNGAFARGQLEKGVLGDGTKGLLKRITSDFGNTSATQFIDNLQNIVTEYMKTSAYSVGISDLIADAKTNDSISEIITAKKREVRTLIDQTHLGIFENKTGKTDEEEFETQINNILNRASNEAGKMGRQSLDKDNRFVIMVNAGSKGSELNISQMISCLGQQNVDGKRIPYGFENRTLPHFNKFDDSPAARGFVENSFISGLSPTELFFHAMGGRVGLIDTAVKTSQTGYIQRRLIKGLEDLKTEYDMTVRNNKGKIIQFAYGDDGIDPTHVESQAFPLVTMGMKDVYDRFYVPTDKAPYTKAAMERMTKQKDDLAAKTKSLIEEMNTQRKVIIEQVFGMRENNKVHVPVGFQFLIDNVQGQQFINVNSLVDITPMEAYEMIEEGLDRLKALYYAPPSKLFETIYRFHMAPAILLNKKRFHRKALGVLIERIVHQYKKSVVAPGEMVGLVAAQSIGEPTTQMTLNTFHFAGVASKSNVTRGVPRIEEIMSLSENPKNPSCTVYLHQSEETELENAEKTMHLLERTRLRDVVDSVQICFDPDDGSTNLSEDADMLRDFHEFEQMVNGCLEQTDPTTDEKSKWVIRIEMSVENMLDRNITMDDVNFAIKNAYQDDVECAFSDYNDDALVFRIRLASALDRTKKLEKPHPLDQSDEICLLKKFQDKLLDDLILRGVKNIGRVIPRKITDSLHEEDGKYVKKESWVLDTVGTNLLDILSLEEIDTVRTFTNDIQEIHRTLGIEAARQAIFNEISDVIEFDSTYINYHHLSVLCDRMTCKDSMVSIFRHGINNDDIGPIAKASFEETPEMFLKAARHAELDSMRGVSANVMCGQEGYFGTSAFQVMLDLDKRAEMNTAQWSAEEEVDDAFIKMTESIAGPCADIAIQSNVQHTRAQDIGAADEAYGLDF